MTYFDDRRIVIARQRFGDRFEGYLRIYPGLIASFGGSTTFAQLGDQWTWVKVWGRNESLVPMLNPTGLREVGTRVLVARDPRPPRRWRILAIDDSYSSDTSDIPWDQYNTPLHGESHQTLDESDPGPDPVFVGQPMLLILKTVGDGSTLTVSTHYYPYNQGGAPRIFTGQATDLTSFVPVAATKIRSVLIYLDRDTNVLNVVGGTIVDDDGVTPIPDPPPPEGDNAEISAWVTLVTAQSTITTATDIRDRRDFLGSGDGTIPLPTEIGQVFMNLDDGAQWATPVIADDEDGGGWVTSGDFLVVKD